MDSPYLVRDVTSWELVNEETSGSDPDKEWLREVPASGDGPLWLFKPVVEKDGRRQGEDWAEKVAAELAAFIDVPTAEIEMATRAGRSGTLSKSFLPDEEWEVQHGAVLLTAIVPDFIPKAPDRRGHNLDNINLLLRGKSPPPMSSVPESFDAFDVFVGYLVFDAWIGNRDRHEENWSVLRDRSGTIWLAPSYDHATSLGFNLTDARRSRTLDGHPGIEHFARRGTAYRFEGGAKQTLVDLAWLGLGRVNPTVGAYWIERLAAVQPVACAQVVGRTQQMSELARSFALELIEVNRRRVLDERDQ